MGKAAKFVSKYFNKDVSSSSKIRNTNEIELVVFRTENAEKFSFTDIHQATIRVEEAGGKISSVTDCVQFESMPIGDEHNPLRASAKITGVLAYLFAVLITTV